jgi:hypothetical protein
MHIQLCAAVSTFTVLSAAEVLLGAPMPSIQKYTYGNTHKIIQSTHFKYTDVLYEPMYTSVFRTITVSVHSVWPIVLPLNLLLHVPLQCRTAMLYLPKLSVYASALLSDSLSGRIPYCNVFTVMYLN